jgi:hypothetical protein
MECFFMARYSRFTFLCDLDERQTIADLAMRLQRSQSDAVRFVVIEAARQLSQDQAGSAPALSTRSAAQEIKQEGMNVTE